MTLDTIRMKTFRAHAGTEMHFAGGVNLIYGANGAGKTNILEAIHYLCLTRSFIQARDQFAVQHGADGFELDGLFDVSSGRRMAVRLSYSAAEGKQIAVNRTPVERFSELVGRFPVVVLSPEDQALTAGPPEERRRFLDNILSQARPAYLESLLHYRRVLRQRNALLSASGRREPDPAELASWNEETALLGSRVIHGRRQFVDLFNEYLAKAYETFDDVGEKPSVTYEAFGGLGGAGSEDEIRESFLRRLRANARQERELGRTLIGPHRDELLFTINGFEVRRYASQGQHRTFGLALKLAQFLFLQDRMDRRPLLLLDDVFGSLDARRTHIFMELLLSDSVGQAFVTATGREPFLAPLEDRSADTRMFEVEDGTVRVDERAPARQIRA